VLRIHVVRQGGHLYYVNHLVPGRAEGTLVAGEEPGVWSGPGAKALGLAGTVAAPAFGEVLNGREPRSGAPLRVSAGERSVAGYDLTFCAPKSVSLLHLLAPGEMAGEVGAGHHAAVVEAADYLQRAALGVRRTRGGCTSHLPSVGMVAGRFLHRTSRTLDPHLHTHLVVANVTQGVDGLWSAVDARRMFAHARATQSIYHARLRMELSDRLGVSWLVSPTGLGEVVGVDTTLRRLFSQRSADIEEYSIRRSGPAPATRTRGAFHATRPDKDRNRTVDSLKTEWKQRARDFGYHLGDLTCVVGPKREMGSIPEIDGDRVRDGLGRLALRNRAVAVRDVVAVIAAASTGGARTEFVEAVAARMVEAAGPPQTRTRPTDRAAALHAVRGGLDAEPRWAASDVALVATRQPEQLLAPAAYPTGFGPFRGAGVERGGTTPAPIRVRPPAVAQSKVVAEMELGR
jgi:conjugative relaxase-like TrwC/TraI family protein